MHLKNQKSFKINNVINKLMMNNPITTFVTAFYVLKDYTNPGKSVSGYFNHFKKLVTTGIPLSVYISPEYKNQLEEIAKENSNVKIAKVIDIKDTWVYKTSNITNIKLPQNRNPLKDTFEYMVCQNIKIECIADTIEKNPFNTDQFAWIDLGIFHVLKNEEKSSNMLKKIANTPLLKDNLIFPGCWFGNYDYINNINWSYCGGFFIGHKDKLIDMWHRYQEFLPKFIQKYNLMSWEVNLWISCQTETDWTVSRYLADHDDSILCIPDQYFVLKIDCIKEN